jgi:hypothetical protein
MSGEIISLPVDAPKVGDTYKHYKGDNYKVTAVALHSDEHVWMVVYEPMYENPAAPLFVKTLDGWNEEVEWEGSVVERFSLVD